MKTIIVGASLAGLAAAEALRAGDYQGDITVIGAESDPPYDRPPLSKGFLTGSISSSDLDLRKPADIDRLECEWRLGQPATGLDIERHFVEIEGGERLSYSDLVLATGARARHLPGTEQLAGVYTLRTKEDAVALRHDLQHGADLVVIGAGVIGVEVASTARSIGVEVTMIEFAGEPLSRIVGKTLGAEFRELLAEDGITFHGTSVMNRLLGGTRVEAVELSDGTLIAADAVLVAIGATPVTDWLDHSGLVIRDGVVCDETCRAIDASNIYAAGDVCRWANPLYNYESMRLEHWTSANEQGRAAAAGILGSHEAQAILPYVWSDQFDTRLQVIGRCDSPSVSVEVFGNVRERRFVAVHSEAGLLVGAIAMGLPRPFALARRALLKGDAHDDTLLRLRRELADIT